MDTQSTWATTVITYCRCDLSGVDGAEEGTWTVKRCFIPPFKATLSLALAPSRSVTVASFGGISPPPFVGHRHPWFCKEACPSLCSILLEKSEQSLLFSVPRPWVCQASGSLPTSLSSPGSASNLTLFSQSAKTFCSFTLETNFPQLTQSYWLNNDFLPHLKVISVGIMTWRRSECLFCPAVWRAGCEGRVPLLQTGPLHFSHLFWSGWVLTVPGSCEEVG